jgi:predicted SAM-dependent methyltransferase
VKLDLACGPVCAKGFDGVDVDDHGQRFTGDLMTYPWMLHDEKTGRVDTLMDDSVSRVRCSHFVEHVPDLVGFMNEVWRVCKAGAIVEIWHPYQHSHRAWQDPTHVRAINELTWKYFDAKARHDVFQVEYSSMKCDFDEETTEFILNPAWLVDEIDEQTRYHAMHFAVNVVEDLHMTLRVRK